MIKSTRILTRRGIFRAGAGLAVAATAGPLLTAASARAEDARQADAKSLNGNGFYRFKIGDFQATVISDGYGQIPIRPILVMNASEAELAPVLKANFMQPVIQATNNILVVDTGRERIIVDTGFGEKLGPSFGSFPRLEANLRRAGITQESIDLVVMSHGHLDHIQSCSPRARSSSCKWVTSPIPRSRVCSAPNGRLSSTTTPRKRSSRARSFLDRVAADQVMVMGYHFPFPAIGHVVRRDTPYHWEAAQWAW